MNAKLVALGRPGSGKTTAVLHIIELAQRRGYSIVRLKEYDILYEMFQNKDDIENKKFLPTEYGGFELIDFSVLDTSLKKLEEKIQRETVDGEHKLVTIELARDDYRKALSKFSPDFLQDSYILFVEADVETCIQRIHSRITNPPKPDHHFVPDHIIRTHYNEDSWEYMAYHSKREYRIHKEVMVYRNIHSYQNLLDKASEFAEIIFKKEFVGESLETLSNDYGISSMSAVLS